MRARARENRREARYKVDLLLNIEHMVYDGQAYPLCVPITGTLINLSKNGIRFRTMLHTLSDGDRVQLRIRTPEGEKRLTADIVSHRDHMPACSEYGGRLVKRGWLDP